MGGGNTVHPDAILNAFGGNIVDLGVRDERGYSELSFVGSDRGRNGVLAVVMDAAMVYALGAELGGLDRFVTITMNLHFMVSVTEEEITAKARVIEVKQNIAFVEAELLGAGGQRYATAGAAMFVMPAREKDYRRKVRVATG